MVIFDTALHVLQLIQDGEHVNELAQCEEIGLGDKVLPPLSVAQALHLAAEPLDSLALEGSRTGSSQQWLMHGHRTTTGTTLHPPPPPPSFNKSIFLLGMEVPGSLSTVTMKRSSVTNHCRQTSSVLEGRRGLKLSICACPECGVFCKIRLQFFRWGINTS